ncbi:hybrid sensor histidine kinase/response regulator [Paracoccus xiamenensis]|uniref:hybrid sensor histidine kinase/response regulator n=1 Tax=Paracoccus xiamenensis TaxID=2714901 RepID=UPI001409B67A|nr:ATP-binding protein [Paracoccus xiamenensis]NHF71758.1 response regulator [Paracoccus xiamenensis]
MAKLLQRLPRNAGLWVPLLALPLVIGELWLHAQGARPNPGLALSLGGLMAMLGWYLLGGSIAWSRAREGLAQRRQLKRLLPQLEIAEDPEWAVASDGMVLAQSPEALDLWGDHVGRPLSQLMAGQLADADGETARLLTRALRHGRAVQDLPDGRKISAERAGNSIVRLSLPHDPSQSVVAEAMDYDRLPIAVLRLSADGTILHANRAAEPYCGGDATGQHVAKLLDGLGRPFDDWLAEALAAGGPAAPEVLRAPRAGQDRFIQVSLHAEDNEPRTLIAVLSDARAVKTLEAQFVQSQKMQAVGQLAGGIAHDFNNLLTAISGHCDLLMLRHDKGHPDYADLDQISQNANRAANLVSHLLAFSRKQTLKPQRVDLRNTIADLSHLLNRLVGEKITLEQRHDPRLDPVRADRGKIEQVIMNLVVNARDAMPEGGRIDVSTQNVDLPAPQLHGRFAVPPGRYVRVAVADCGCGIPPDMLGKIFEPFFTTKRLGEGTGLGLSTAYGIIKQTGGYIMCDSVLGEGTTFTIYLPVHLGADLEPDEPDVPARAVSMTAPPELRVLLVEDEAPVRAFASRALKLRGYQVIEAASGEEALELLTDDRLKVDLFVSDVVMPGLDGLSWVRHALKDRPGTRVIFMSGYTEDVFEDGRNPVEGASFLQKPFSLTDLISAVGDKLEHAA